MSTETKKMSPGVILMIVAAVLSIIGVVFYLGYNGMKASAVAFTIASAAVAIVLVIAKKVLGPKPFLNLAATASALLVAEGIVISLPNQIYGFGYLVAGLYTFDDIRNGVFFLIPAVIAMILYIAASFTNISES